MIKSRLICTIGTINFYTWDKISNDKKLVFTDNENFYIDLDEEETKACNRIFNNYYI